MTQQELLEKIGGANSNLKQSLKSETRTALESHFADFKFPSKIFLHEDGVNELHVIFSVAEEYVFNASLDESVEKILDKAFENDTFKRKLMANPTGTLAEELPNFYIPDGFKIYFYENTEDELHILLPNDTGEDGELSEAELEAVAGGGKKGPHVGRRRGGRAPKCRSQKFRRK